MNNIAIIPARGGSKRLPRKNILPLGDTTLLSHVVDCCLKSQLFCKVIVSTEDEEISKIATNSGAFIHEREESLAQDKSTVVEVCEDVLKNEVCDNFCCVYATSGLLTSKTLKSSYAFFQSNRESNVLMGVSVYNYSPFQALRVNQFGYAELMLPEYMDNQSQVFPKVRVSNGSFYWGRRSSFMKEKTFYSQKLMVFDVPEDEVCDVDTQSDYEKLLRKYNDIV
ncbi:acylneuraminate cytidylyltransferase family protein [Vreelandella sp. 2A-K22]|tara:strand:+ start:12414 stop:13085 length:672 start_codon:yes stop_codon:yes gene_type:complete